MILTELSTLMDFELQTQSMSLQKRRLKTMTLIEKLTLPLYMISKKLLTVLIKIPQEQQTERKQGRTCLAYMLVVMAGSSNVMQELILEMDKRIQGRR